MPDPRSASWRLASDAAGEETAEGPGSSLSPLLSSSGPGASEVTQQIIRSAFVVSEQWTITILYFYGFVRI